MIEMILKGMIVSGTLIMAIGSQNAFVIKEGLLKSNILVVCLVCILCDFFLMMFGVLFVGEFINKNILFTIILALLGAVFLLYYGFTSFRSSFTSTEKLNINFNELTSEKNYKKAIFATLAVTLLNPHVYLDTVVIIGGIAGTLSYINKIYFFIGTLSISVIWFFGLGYGIRLLSPFFMNPRNWRILEFIIGCVMWLIAFGLLQFALSNI